MLISCPIFVFACFWFFCFMYCDGILVAIQRLVTFICSLWITSCSLESAPVCLL